MMPLKKFLKAGSILRYENICEDATVTGGHTDSRLVTDGSIYFCLRGSRNDGHDFIGKTSGTASVSVAAADFVNQKNHPVIYSENVEKTLSEFAALWRKEHKAVVFGITGSNGKTTTKEMLVNILSKNRRLISTYKNYNNHIGVPLTLFNIKEDTDTALVEMGTNSPGEISSLCKTADPDLGIITNVGDAHLEQLGNREGVYREKTALFEHLFMKNGKILLNADDEYLSRWNRGNVIRYGTGSGVKYSFTNISMTPGGYSEFLFEGYEVRLKVPGMLNVKNALAAAASASELGVAPDVIAEALSSYVSSDKRYEKIRYKNSGVLLDCYNANPTSTAAFLNDVKVMGIYNTVILGDMFELGPESVNFHRKIIELAVELKIRKLLLTGAFMKKALEGIDKGQTIMYFENFADLKKAFDEEAEKGENIAVKGSRKMELEKLAEGAYAG